MAPRVKARAAKPEDLGSNSIKVCVEDCGLLSKVVRARRCALTGLTEALDPSALKIQAQRTPYMAVLPLPYTAVLPLQK